MKIRLKLLLVALLLFFAGCEQEAVIAQPAQQAEPSKPSKLATSEVKKASSIIFMQKGVEISLGETISEALPVWRKHAAQKPVLLLLAKDPALFRPPEVVLDDINRVFKNGSDKELDGAGNPRQPAPLFLPSMAIEVALRQGLFKEFSWALPLAGPEQTISLDILREQMASNQIINEDESSSLALSNGSITGRLRDIPFSVGRLEDLRISHTPLIVHIDLGYFQAQYKNEVTTPVIPMVMTTLQKLRELQLPVLAATFSYSHNESGIPLNVRFLGEFIRALAEDPERLSQPLPRRWSNQKEILFFEHFYQNDEIRKLVEQQLQESADSPWVLYNLYHTATLFKEHAQALSHLAKAVQLDPVYGMEYLLLAQQAFEKQQLGKALEHMLSASAAFPDDPFLKLRIVELAIKINNNEIAKRLINELQQLSWSTAYFAEIPTYLAELQKRIKT